MQNCSKLADKAEEEKHLSNGIGSFFAQSDTEIGQQHQPVVVKDLEAVDIQYANDCVLPMKHRVVVFDFNDAVDAAHNPAEKSLVQRLERGNKSVFDSVRNKVTTVKMSYKESVSQ